jgi:hypothetical protein
MDAAARSQIASGVTGKRHHVADIVHYRAHGVAGGYPSSSGETRLLGYARRVGGGAVTYLALGHCHNSYARLGRTAGGGSQQLAPFREPRESEAFFELLSNTIAWSTGTTS